jgi:hypothetical protein
VIKAALPVPGFAAVIGRSLAGCRWSSSIHRPEIKGLHNRSICIRLLDPADPKFRRAQVDLLPREQALLKIRA